MKRKLSRIKLYNCCGGIWELHMGWESRTNIEVKELVGITKRESVFNRNVAQTEIVCVFMG